MFRGIFWHFGDFVVKTNLNIHPPKMALKDLARYSTGLDFMIFLLGFDVTNFFGYFLCSLIDDEYSVSI